MVLSIFWLIENSAWINLSKFWWKFQEKTTSGNTGLNFFSNQLCLCQFFFLKWKTWRNWVQCYQKWLFHEIFTKTLTGLFTLNFRLIKKWKAPSYSTLKTLHHIRLSAILIFSGYPTTPLRPGYHMDPLSDLKKYSTTLKLRWAGPFSRQGPQSLRNSC